MSLVDLALVTADDADALIRANLESRDLHHPWVHPPTDQAAFDAWYGRTRESASGEPLVALVAREPGGAIAGVITFGGISFGLFQNAYLGYYGMARTQGCGLMTEALRLACRFGFESIGLHRLEANIQPGNAASIALARRVGFRLEGYSRRYLCIGGVWRDHERWALLADEAPSA